jgi:hypothetical protein
MQFMPTSEKYRWAFIINTPEKNIRLTFKDENSMNSLLYAFAHIYRNDTNRPLYDQKALMGEDTSTYTQNSMNVVNDSNYQNANMQTLPT